MSVSDEKSRAVSPAASLSCRPVFVFVLRRVSGGGEDRDLAPAPLALSARTNPDAPRVVQKQPIPKLPRARRLSAPERSMAGQSRPSYLPRGKRPEYHSAAVPKVTAKTHIGD